MAPSIKIRKLTRRIKERAGEILLTEINDPRLGFVTVTRVDLSNDLSHCTIFYSVLGDEAQRRTTERAMADARGYVQRRVAEILRTRTTPALDLRFDPSIEGVIRVARILDGIARERDEEPRSADAPGDADGHPGEEPRDTQRDRQRDRGSTGGAPP